MTPQEIFDTVVRHLFKQGKRSDRTLSNGNSVCCYRTEAGLKCAVGVLIPDDVYDPVMDDVFTGEGTGIAAMLRKHRDKLPSWFSDNLSLLKQLQIIHDDEYNWSSSVNMKCELKMCAKEFGLNTNVLRNKRLTGENA